MRNRQTRRDVLGGLAGAGITGIAGCVGGDGGGTPTGTPGSGSDESYTFGMSVMGTGLSWFRAFLKGGEWYANDHGHEWRVTDAEFEGEKQIRQANSLISEGVDALIVMPIDSATSSRIAEAANENDIPVFTSNSTINSNLVERFISFGNYNAANQVGRNIVELLEEKYGEPKGKVMAGQDSQSYQLGVARRKGFHDALSDYPNIEVVNEFASAEGADQAFQAFNNMLLEDSDIDALYGANQPKLTGGLRALERQDMKKKIGEDGHVVFGSIDAGPAAISAIKDEFVDFIVDQPTQHYNALVVELLIRYLDSGKDDSVLPQMGEEVTTDDVMLEGETHVGIDPWEEQLWAPANVVPYEVDGEEMHPYVKTSHSVINTENADAPYLWGNWVGEV